MENREQEHAPMGSAGPPLLLWGELLFLFVILPLVVLYDLAPGHKSLPLFVGFAYCLVILLRDPAFDRRLLSLRRAPGWGAVLLRAGLALPALVLLVLLTQPDALFHLVRERTGLWLLILVAYPVWSAYPQELIYRAFFFHRYRSILGGRIPLVLASSLLFAYGHIIFNSWLALVLTFLGGLLFCRTYLASRSLTTVFIEHALLGNLIFTLGLGKHFFALSKGSRVAQQACREIAGLFW
jgi:uncharacterized protein